MVNYQKFNSTKGQLSKKSTNLIRSFYVLVDFMYSLAFGYVTVIVALTPDP
jgi:hypothetical protein